MLRDLAPLTGESLHHGAEHCDSTEEADLHLQPIPFCPAHEMSVLPTREESIYAWFGGGSADASVMVARLEEIDLVLSNQVHDAVFLRKSAGPNVWCQILQRLRLTDPSEWISEDRFHQIE